MRVILLTHPAAFDSVSMTRYARMIGEGLRERGHEVAYWTSDRSFFGRIAARSPSLRKWLGYGDQFLLYPRRLRRLVAAESAETLFVLTDQALGIWTPALRRRPHVIHCHDFLALRSALGEFPENPTAWTGRCYQQFILRGFRRGRAFLSVSHQTQSELHGFLGRPPAYSEVILNAVDERFTPGDEGEGARYLAERGLPLPRSGYILHVGVPVWYKNHDGVLAAYRALAAAETDPPALVLVPGRAGDAATVKSPLIHPLGRVSAEALASLYRGARLLLFPSLEEGFGWPIAEAMASGCPVLTTDQPPMTEVGGDAAVYLPRSPRENRDGWAREVACALRAVLAWTPEQRECYREAAARQSARFRRAAIIAQYEASYLEVLRRSGVESPAEVGATS